MAGTTLADQVDLVRLDPQFRYRWADGSTLTVPDGDDDTADAFEEFAPGAGDQWRTFDARGQRIWDVSRADVLRRADVEPAGRWRSGCDHRST